MDAKKSERARQFGPTFVFFGYSKREKRDSLILPFAVFAHDEVNVHCSSPAK